MEQIQGITKDAKPDLVMQINVTPQQMEYFAVEVHGSILTKRGMEGWVEGDIGMAEIPDENFDFSTAVKMSLNYFTSKTKPRMNAPYSLQLSDYLEFKVTYADGTESAYYIEKSPDIPIQKIEMS
jgi:hypothetical protein